MTAAPSNRTLIIPGGGGYLGQHLARFFVAQNWRVIILSRHPAPDSDGIRHIQWDGKNPGPWQAAFDGASAVVNLAGRTVNCRYNARNKREIYESRLLSTLAVGRAIASAANPPAVWINSSSATIYRDARDRPMDETTGEIGSGFSVDVCQKWEHTLMDAPAPATRKVAIRTAMVFGLGAGGVYEAFRNIVRLGLGGTLGRGDQFVSWIHMQDFCQAVQWLVENDGLSDPVNLSAPNPVLNRDFMRTFREVCQKKIGLPATKWMLEIGAFFLRTETELLLKSRRVVPGKLLESGFEFQYPNFRQALEEIENRGVFATDERPLNTDKCN
jgi:hypothetical protein